MVLTGSEICYFLWFKCLFPTKFSFRNNFSIQDAKLFPFLFGNFGPCKFLMLARINLAWAFFAVIAIHWYKEHLTVFGRNGSAECIRGIISGPVLYLMEQSYISDNLTSIYG